MPFQSTPPSDPAAPRAVSFFQSALVVTARALVHTDADCPAEKAAGQKLTGLIRPVDAPFWLVPRRKEGLFPWISSDALSAFRGRVKILHVWSLLMTQLKTRRMLAKYLVVSIGRWVGRMYWTVDLPNQVVG